ncbi:MAG TPA: phage holin family protein [Candidatus Acidoferrales bacterium]|nr:phage holin family protein [Candidatus Acidoferrales bacterium]
MQQRTNVSPPVDQLQELPVGELLKRLTTEMTTLMRQELELAKTEITERGKEAAPAVGMFGAATLLALGAFGALTAFLITLLGLVMPIWGAALIVALVYGLAAYVMSQTGKKKIEDAVPLAPQTVETMKENISWAKTHKKSVGT